MTDQTRRQLAEIHVRHQRRRRCPTPDQVIELMEDCEQLMRMVARLLGRNDNKREGTHGNRQDAG